MKTKHIFYSVLACTLMLSSCDLEVTPVSEIPEDAYWKTEMDAANALNALYSTLQGPDLLDEVCTDNAHSHKPWEGPFELIQMNGITPINDMGYDYSTVRKANSFIKNVDNCNMDETLKGRMKAEARFFRALNYLELATKFGKAYIFEDVPEYNAPNVHCDKLEDVKDFILTELGEIAEILPGKYDNSKYYEKGRITRDAALALRARAALYLGDYPAAEESAWKVISENRHELFKINALNDAQLREAKEMEKYIDFDQYPGIDKDRFIKGMFSYEALWHKDNANPSNPEYILTREYMADDNNFDWTRYTYIRPSQMGYGYCSFEPMQDLIDAYWTIDGKKKPELISEETRRKNYSDMWIEYFAAKDGDTYKSISQTDYLKKVPGLNIKNITYMEEFRNRDSRLYASIQFPLKGWQETDFSQGDYYFMWDPFKAGEDTNESWTGYCFRKMVALTSYKGENNVEDYPMIRYAEVLLTYAEAHIMNSGWDEKVTKELNKLRDRCGMPDVPISFATRDEALEFVRNERRIELAGEGHRFDDIRRYGNDYCEDVMNGPTYAPCGSFDFKKQEWAGYKVVEKTWNKRLLLMPIPTTAIDVNPLLKDDQNPGY